MYKRQEQEHAQLAEAFSRGFTTAYLEGKRGNEIMSYGRPNNRGVFIGRVASVKNGKAAVACERPIVAGDVLEFWTNKGHFAYTVSQVAVSYTHLLRRSGAASGYVFGFRNVGDCGMPAKVAACVRLKSTASVWK